MARPIVLSNGELHVGLNKFGLVHDFYYPYVGFENHAGGSHLRHKVGIFIDGAISWLDNGDWEFRFEYPHTALIGHTRAKNDKLNVILEFDDAVDAETSVFMRNVHVINLGNEAKEIKLYMHQAFAIGDSRSNTDTAQYLPDSDAILHYRGRRAFVIAGQYNKKPFDQYSIGLFGIEGHEGSFRDAEDGQLDGVAVLVDGPECGVRALHRCAIDDQANLLAGDAFLLNAAQRGLADEIRLHVEVHQTVKPQLIGVRLDIRIGVIGQHPTFDPAD